MQMETVQEKGERGGSSGGGGGGGVQGGERRGEFRSTSAGGVSDMGAICMPHHVQRLQRLVDEAVGQGAQVVVGGKIPLGSCEDLSCSPRRSEVGREGLGEAATAAAAVAAAVAAAGTAAGTATAGTPAPAAAAASEGALPFGSSSSCRLSLGGQFYPPTVLVNVQPTMRILHEEVFGPLMCIVKFENDQEVVAVANDCPFGLGCSVFSRDRRRAAAIGAAVQCGMVAINDFGCTYMCQSLPFGGVKESGFGRFAGVEGLRGCCNEKAIVEDRFYSLFKTNIPPPLQYPLAPNAVPFQQALVRMFFAHTLLTQLSGLFHLLLELMRSPKRTNTQQRRSSAARAAGAGAATAAARHDSGVAATGGERPHIE
ncbi:unnamed protein product [Closterium sp. NIES-53]